MNVRRCVLLLAVLLCAGAATVGLPAGGKTIETAIQPPANFKRMPVAAGTFAATLRELELAPEVKVTLGDGKTSLCADQIVGVTLVTPFDNTHDIGVDGIVKLWGEYLWKNHPGSISFPLDNGQVALWKDWRDGLRPKKNGGRFIFTQVTTPSGGYPAYQDFLSFVAEEMGAIALKRESTIITYDDSVTVGDVLVALDKDNQSHIGILLDACKGAVGEKLYLLGTCGTPSTNLYVMRPYSPVQGLNEWFSLDGARWAIGKGARTDLRRVTLK